MAAADARLVRNCKETGKEKRGNYVVFLVTPGYDAEVSTLEKGDTCPFRAGLADGFR